VEGLIALSGNQNCKRRRKLSEGSGGMISKGSFAFIKPSGNVVSNLHGIKVKINKRVPLGNFYFVEILPGQNVVLGGKPMDGKEIRIHGTNLKEE
jgi:hypothetical protein